MKAALLKLLPKKLPGMTQIEMRQAVLSHLPEAEFPGGAKANWWLKVVQFDLEAKVVLKRDGKSEATSMVPHKVEPVSACLRIRPVT
jgi:hypothetical protein